MVTTLSLRDEIGEWEPELIATRRDLHAHPEIGLEEVRTSGIVAERLRAMTPAGHEAVIHVTLTDDHPWAQAFVVIEARPLTQPGAARA